MRIRSVAVALFSGFHAIAGFGADEAPTGSTIEKARPANAKPAGLDDFRPKLEQLVTPYLEAGWVQGMVVGVVDGEESRVWGFGRISSGNDRAPDGKTIFEIGSITKMFTEMILCDQVTKGRMRFDDPVAKHLPEGVKVPKGDLQEITLMSLVSHASGLSRDSESFSYKDAAAYTRETLFEDLGRCKLAYQPGKGSVYSNFGFGLLSHALAFRNDTSYEALLADAVTRPLGMADTAIALTPEQTARWSPGYDADGRTMPNFTCPGLPGAGMVRSTGEDMVKLLQAFLAKAPSPAIQAYRGMVMTGRPNLVKFGSTPGFRSVWAVDAKNRKGIVLLTNSGSVSAMVCRNGSRRRWRWARHLLGLPAEGPAAKPETLKRYEGRYLLPEEGGFNREAVVEIQEGSRRFSWGSCA